MGAKKTGGTKRAAIRNATRFITAQSRPWMLAAVPTVALLVLGSSFAMGKSWLAKNAEAKPFRAIHAGGSMSQAYGSIHNFDVVNDTGVECHGFEIEIHDCRSTDISYTYDYNHYGTPRITEDLTDPAHPITYVRYESGKNPDGTWKAYTAIPSAPLAPTDGHQFIDPTVNIGGEHFGVGFFGNPSAVKYSWLKDDGAGNLVFAAEVIVGTPTFNYVPPAVGAPPVVQAVIAPPEPIQPPQKEFGDPMWVRETRTVSHNSNQVELHELVTDDPDDPNDPDWTNGEEDEVEVEWTLLQEEFNQADGGANGKLEAEPEELVDGDEVITRRWDFFEYTGPIDNETGEAKADEVAADDKHGVGIKEINGHDVDLGQVEVVGNFIGAQMSAFDPQQQMGLIDHVQDGEIDTPYVDRSMVIGGTNPVTVSRNGALPTGMSFSTSTGVLSGTPTTAGNYSFSLTATDGAGKNVTKNYLLKVVDPNAPANLAATTLSVTNIDGVAGTNATLAAKLVYTDGGAGLAGRAVDFRVDGTLVGSGTTDASGNATCSWAVPIATASGAHTITAEYAGDADTASTNGNGTLTVKVGTSAAAADATTTYLAKVTMKGTLKANGVALGAKSLTFFVDGAPVGTAPTTSAGLSTITPIATQSVGTHALNTEFAGDTTYAASASPAATLTIGKGISLMAPAAGTGKYGGNTTVKATLKVGSTPIAGETIDFKVDGTSVGTGVTNTSGVASRTFKCLNSVGTHTLTPTFAGSSLLEAVSANTTLKVSLGTTKILGDVLKSPAGTVVAFGATLTRTTDNTALAGKTVSFIDAATLALIGTGTTNASGKATVNVTVPAKGVKRSISVKFATDGSHAAATGSGSVTGL